MDNAKATRVWPKEDPVFPYHTVAADLPGISLRDLIALVTMYTILESRLKAHQLGEVSYDMFAMASYKLADAMIKRRDQS